MKASTFNAAATLLFAAVACCAPLTLKVRDGSSSDVVIDIKTGDGDSATTISVPLDQVTTTSGQSSAAVAASISVAGVFCQAFSDAAASEPVGPVFSLGSDASYSASSSGDTASNAADAVPIGSFLCSDSQAGVAPKSSSSSSSSSTVHVQLEQVSDQFVQTDVPTDASVVATAHTILGTQGLDLSLISASGVDLDTVSCQLFQDAAATVPVGNPATAATDAVLSTDRNDPAQIAAIKCSVAAA